MGMNRTLNNLPTFQAVSCELGVSWLQERIVAIALYVSEAATIILVIFVTNRLGNRKTILGALYASIFFTLHCAVVPGYWTLLLSRVMIGFCVGLNVHPIGVFLSQGASNRRVYETGTLAWLFGYGLACVWVGVLAYLALDKLDWRWFIIVTSLPVFIPPIVMLHKVFTVDFDPKETDTVSNEKKQGTKDRMFWVNLFKISAAYFLVMVLKFGWILLTPNLLRTNNANSDQVDSNDPCAHVVKDEQFLYLAMSNVGLVLSPLLAYLIKDRISFFWKQLLTALVALSGYILLALTAGHQSATMVTVIASIENLVIDVALCDFCTLQYDPDLFGLDNLPLASNIIGAIATIGAVIGSSFASFFPVQHAVIIFLVTCVLYLLLILFMEFNKV